MTNALDFSQFQYITLVRKGGDGKNYTNKTVIEKYNSTKIHKITAKGAALVEFEGTWEGKPYHFQKWLTPYQKYSGLSEISITLEFNEPILKVGFYTNLLK